MSLLASSRDGYAQTGWRPVVAVTLAFCLIPAFLGGFAYGLVRLAGSGVLGPDFFSLAALTTLIALSPLISWPFWATTGLCAALLMRRGWYGALPAVLVGTAAGALTAIPAELPILTALGAILATFHRFALALLRPLAF